MDRNQPETERPSPVGPIFRNETRHVPTLSEVFGALQNAFRTVREFDFTRISPFVTSSTRQLGMSVAGVAGRIMKFIVDRLSLVISPQLSSIFECICDFIKDMVLSICQKLQEFILTHNVNIHHFMSYIIGVIIICIGLSLPRHALTTLGRVLMLMSGALTLYMQDNSTAAMAVIFSTIVTALRTRTHHHQVQFQSEFTDDLKDWMGSALMALTMCSFSMAGLDVPSDKKSLNEMLSRHAVLGRALMTYEKLSEYFSSLLEKSFKMVSKYYYHREYVTLNTAPEVDRVVGDILEYVKSENYHKALTDLEEMDKVEALYMEYQHLLQLHSRYPNTAAYRSLQQVGSFFTSLHRIVISKNPKAYTMRMEPVCVIFYGDSGVGKSWLMSPLQQDCLKISGDLDENGSKGKVYARNVEQEFWDGYNGQEVVIIDEFAQRVDSQTNPNLEFFEIIRAVNIFPYQLHSAALEQKANNAFRAKFVIATSNLSQWKAESIHDEDALERRLHLQYKLEVIPECRDTYVRNGQTKYRLNPDKVAERRQRLGLAEDDYSHWKFVRDGVSYTYDDVIVQISKRYERNLRDYESRTKIAQMSVNRRLPEGAFSENSRWVYQPNPSVPQESTAGPSHVEAQADNERKLVPLQVFMSCPINVMEQLLNQGYNVVNHDIRLASEMPEFNSVGDVQTFIENNAQCARILRPISWYENVICRAGLIPPSIVRRLIDHQRTRSESLQDRLSRLMREFNEENRERAERMPPMPAPGPGLMDNMIELSRIISQHRNVLPWYIRYNYFMLYHQFWMSQMRTSEEQPIRAYRWAYNLMIFVTQVVCSTILTSIVAWAVHGLCDMLKIKRRTKDRILKFMSVAPNLFQQACLAHINFMTGRRTLGYLWTGSFLAEFAIHAMAHSQYERDCEECEHHERVASEVEESFTIQAPSINFVNIQQNMEELKKIEQEKIFGEVAAAETGDKEPRKAQSYSARWHAEKIQPEYKENQRYSGKSSYHMSDDIDPEIQALFPHKVAPEGPVSKQADDVTQLIRRCQYILFVHADGKEHRIGIVTMLGGHKAIINFHYIQLVGVYYQKCSDKSKFLLELRVPGQSVCYPFSIEYLLGAKRIYRGGTETEFYIWTVPKQLPQAPFLVKHVITSKELNKLGNHMGVRVLTFNFNDSKFPQREREGPIRSHNAFVTMDDILDKTKTRCFLQSIKYEIATQPGDCGAAIVVMSDAIKNKLIGFHFGGMVGMGTGSIICAEDVAPYLRKEMEGITLNQPQIFDDVKVEPQFADPQFPLEGSFRLVGKTTQPVYQPRETTLRPSTIHGFMGPSTMMPSRLGHPLDPDGPMVKGLQKNAGPVYDVDEKILWDATKSYLDRLKDFPPTQLERKVLTFEEACAGIPGEEHFPGLKRSKSAGWPWCTKATAGKKDWLGEDEWDFSSDENKKLRQAVNELEEMCRQGKVPEVIFIDTLKDEKRDIQKVKEGKTRVFSAAPMHFSILMRKYFLGAFAYLARTRILNEACIGTNVYSRDWEELANFLSIFGKESIAAGDFKNFDGTILIRVFAQLCYIINQIYGDSEQNQKVREVIFEILMKSLHLIHDFVYQMSHGQPSGNPGTASLNSMYVSLIFRYVFGLLGLDLALFNELVRLASYGDDTLVAVHPSIRHIFNGEAMREIFRKIGMDYTDEDKNDAAPQFKDLSEVTFLKRRFSFDPKRRWWFAPLELRSIIEMCNWVRKGQPAQTATDVNVENAQFELFHHDEETFNQFKAAVQRAYNEIRGPILAWKPWEVGRDEIVSGAILGQLTEVNVI